MKNLNRYHISSDQLSFEQFASKMAKIKKKGKNAEAVILHVHLCLTIQKYRHLRRHTKLLHPHAIPPQTPNLPPRFPPAMHLQRHLPARASKQKASLLFVNTEHNFLLCERHPIPPPRTAPREVQSTESVVEEDQQGARKGRSERCAKMGA